MSIARILPRAVLAMGAAGLVASSGEAHGQDGTAPAPAEPARDSPANPPQEQSAAAKDYAFEIGGRAAYLSPPIRGGANPFGAGFGARLGLAFAGGLYLGGTIADFLGGKDVDVSYRALLVGVEAGYGLRVPVLGGAALTLRPQVGIGNASIYYTDPSLSADVVTSASGSSSSSDTLTVNALYVEPGVLAMLSSVSHFAAVRATALMIPSIAYGGAEPATWISYGVEGQLGFVF